MLEMVFQYWSNKNRWHEELLFEYKAESILEADAAFEKETGIDPKINWVGCVPLGHGTPNWTTEPPTEPGTYWFFGDEVMGGMGQDYTDEAHINTCMSLVKIRRISNGLMAVANGHFMSLHQFDQTKKREGHIGYWAPAKLPEAPDDTENVFVRFLKEKTHNA